MTWTELKRRSLQPLTPKLATVFTGIAALILSATMFQAYFVSGRLWIVAVMLGLYFAASTFTLVLQLKNPASAILMMRTFVGPAAVVCCLGWLLVSAMQGSLDELRLMSAF